MVLLHFVHNPTFFAADSTHCMSITCYIASSVANQIAVFVTNINRFTFIWSMVENPTIPPHMHCAWDKFKCFDWLRRQKLSILIWTINKELSACVRWKREELWLLKHQNLTKTLRIELNFREKFDLLSKLAIKFETLSCFDWVSE